MAATPPPGAAPASRRLRVVLAVEGTRGDVFPMLALGRALAARGHEVDFCASPDNARAVESQGLRFHPAGRDVRAYLQEKASLIAGASWRLAPEIERYIRASAADQMRVLLPLAARADRVLGAGVQFGAPVAALAHGVPYRMVIYCPTLLQSAEHPPFLLPPRLLPRWINRPAWRLVRAWVGRVGRSLLDAHGAMLDLPEIEDFYRLTISPAPVLAADRLLAPAPTDPPVPVLQVPCLHPLDGWEDEALPDKLEAFLEQGPPPVFIGFGSMTDPAPARTTRAVLDALARLSLRGVISHGWAGLGDGALPEGVLAVGAVSHARLFPRMAAVVHHGGAGTTTTAARAGVPQIVVPHFLDQHYWAGRVRELGLGPPPIPRTKLSAERLTAALRETVGNEIVAERAQELGRRLHEEARAAPDPDSWVASSA